MGGRVTDIDGVPGNPSIFYVSGADGGIHKTTDGGINFTPIFENQRAYSIGALTISPSDSNVIWVGTGEGDPRNSVGYGWGVYRSLNGGKTWKNRDNNYHRKYEKQKERRMTLQQKGYDTRLDSNQY